MAMFELEDSEDINLEKCKTDGETLLKGKKLTNVDAYGCEVKKPPVLTDSPESRSGSFLGKSLGWVMAIVGAVIAAAITAWLGLS